MAKSIHFHELPGDELVADHLKVRVLAVDEKTHGGARHKYRVIVPENYNGIKGCTTMEINFQEGPIKESGLNGITCEILLAIVKDRLFDFQAGEYACDENADALHFVNNALMLLKNRTITRKARGVEGTSDK